MKQELEGSAMIPLGSQKLPHSLISNLICESCCLSFHSEVPGISCHKQSYQYELEETTRMKSTCINFIHGNKKGNQEAVEGVQLVSWGTPKWERGPSPSCWLCPFCQVFQAQAHARVSMIVVQVLPVRTQHTGTRCCTASLLELSRLQGKDMPDNTTSCS